MTGADEVSKIKVGKFTVGIIGLKTALEEAARSGLAADQETAQHLLRGLKGRNYVPGGSEPEYAEALLREYRACLGEPAESGEEQGLEVRILGPGCPNCDKLEQMVYKVMAAEGIAGSVEHVREIGEIAAYGPLPAPALVINGRAKCGGRLPRESQLRLWLTEALAG
jgi:hypothetical protein